jgi:transcriptional repressor of cell division inhibition gene dicB
MEKQKAIEMLGGSVSLAAKKIGVSYQAVRKWPEVLSPRVADRVVAAMARNRNKQSKQQTAEA